MIRSIGLKYLSGEVRESVLSWLERCAGISLKSGVFLHVLVDH